MVQGRQGMGEEAPGNVHLLLTLGWVNMHSHHEQAPAVERQPLLSGPCSRDATW